MRWLVALVAVVGMSRALADPAGADRASAEAETHAKAGDFVGAAAKFREAYAEDARPEFLCNVGVAYHKAKELPRAHLFLSRCLEHGASLDTRFVDQVRGVVAATEVTLRTGPFTPVDITVEPAGATVAFAEFAPDETVIGSHLVWLPSKAHRVTVRAEGYVEQTVPLEARGHDVIKLGVVLVHVPAPPPPPPHEEPPPPPPPAARPSKLPAIAASIVTVGAAVVGGIAFANGHSRAQAAAFALTPATYQDDVASVDRWNQLMAVSGIVAVIGAGASAYLWYRAEASQPHVGVEAFAGGGSIFVRGAF